MHPQVKQNEMGKCPLCFMDLIPLKNDNTKDTKTGGALKFSPHEEALAEVLVQPVERKAVSMNITLVGKIGYNESSLSHITARIPGRIDKLFVNYTGMAVRKKDHMAEYYSPDLLVAQQELLIASRNKSAGNDSNFIAVKKKLKLWGLTDENISQILKTGKVSDHIVLYPPSAGIVIDKPAVEGKYFKTGDRLFTVADLSKVWVNLDAYESDLQWLRYGQKVVFTSVAYPGKEFEGRISFIDPVLNPKTRTVRVRVDATNNKGLLKPEMFVKALIEAKVAAAGKVIDTSLSGKWVSPMHPEIVKDGPGSCDVCGMDLVKAEALGYTNESDIHSQPPLVIPISAPLITGKRAVVYVRDPKEAGVYHGREVVLGQRLNHHYIVKSGLKEGELVVTNGNFKIDSALQITAKPSMMSENAVVGSQLLVDSSQKPEQPAKPGHAVSVEFRSQLDMILISYFEIQKGLSSDSYSDALEAGKKLLKMIDHIQTADLNAVQLELWSTIRLQITQDTKKLLKSSSIAAVRELFQPLSTTVERMVKEFGTSGNVAVLKFQCPMAFNNKGGTWLQDKDGVLNPYYGEMMLQCGERIEEVR